MGANVPDQKSRGSVHISIPTAKVSKSDSSYSSSLATTSAVTPSTLESSSTSFRSSISMSADREDDEHHFDRLKSTQVSNNRATRTDPHSSAFVEGVEKRGEREEGEMAARHSVVERQVLHATDSSSPATQSVISTLPPQPQGVGELSVSDLTPSEVQFNPEGETPATATSPKSATIPLQRTYFSIVLYCSLQVHVHVYVYI